MDRSCHSCEAARTVWIQHLHAWAWFSHALQVVLIGDGQVTMGMSVIKPNARKVRKIGDGVIVGFAGERRVRASWAYGTCLDIAYTGASDPHEEPLKLSAICPHAWSMHPTTHGPWAMAGRGGEGARCIPPVPSPAWGGGSAAPVRGCMARPFTCACNAGVSAGSAADGMSLVERLEAKLEEHPGAGAHVRAPGERGRGASGRPPREHPHLRPGPLRQPKSMRMSPNATVCTIAGGVGWGGRPCKQAGVGAGTQATPGACIAVGGNALLLLPCAARRCRPADAGGRGAGQAVAAR